MPVSTTSRSYILVTPYFYYGLCYVFKLLCHDFHMVGFHVSVEYRTPNFSSTNHEGNKKSSLHYKLREFQLSLKTPSYINSICNIYCVDIHKFLSKTICCLKKNHNKKSAERKWRNFHYISILKLQNLISRISVPPFPSVQPFADVLQNRCS